VEHTKLEHGFGQAERFYGQFSEPALIGMKSPGNSQWVVEPLGKLGHALWGGDAAKIRASEARQQKHDRRDAELQHLAMNQGIIKKRKLWSRAGEKGLPELPLQPWGDRRREGLFRMR
jgi:hypothetical protein